MIKPPGLYQARIDASSAWRIVIVDGQGNVLAVDESGGCGNWREASEFSEWSPNLLDVQRDLRAAEAIISAQRAELDAEDEERYGHEPMTQLQQLAFIYAVTKDDPESWKRRLDLIVGVLRDVTPQEAVDISNVFDNGGQHAALVMQALSDVRKRYYVSGEGWVGETRIIELADEIRASSCRNQP